jgi:hypothetical protein
MVLVPDRDKGFGNYVLKGVYLKAATVDYFHGEPLADEEV